MTPFIFWTFQLVAVPALSPLAIGIVRKMKARLQNRVGAGVFQPYRDLSKLFRKDEAVSTDASWIFLSAPYVVFAVTLVVSAGIPIFAVPPAPNLLGDFLSVAYLLAGGVFFLALAGLDVGSAFGGFGSSREATVSALAEGGMLFSFAALAFSAHSTNLFAIARAVAALPFVSFAPVVLAFFAFLFALLAETGRFPFDNPSTHLELTMIHEAMILEYSGKRLALIEWASANKFLIFVALAANLFFPWGLASGADPASFGWGMLFFALKALALAAFVAILESSMAKFRFFRLPDLLFASFVLSVISMSLIV